MKKCWFERGKEGILQEKEYLDKFMGRKMNSFDIEERINYLNEVRCNQEHDDKLERCLNEFLSHNKGLFAKNLEKVCQLLIEVDMKKISPNIYGTQLNTNIKEYNELIVNAIDEHNKIYGIDEKSFEEKDQFNFIYIVQRNDGMVAVVGKSSFYREDQTKGDLYQRLDLSGLAGTENIILRTLIGDELAEKVDSLLTNYYKKAWLIPIPVPRNLERRSEIDIFVKKYEQKLGQWISNNKKIPILNVYSHQH